MLKNKLSIYFIFISIFTVITAFVAIVQRSYANLIGPSQKIDTQKLLNKIDPNLDTSIIQEIQNRPESIDNGQLNFLQESTDITGSPNNNEASKSSVIIEPIENEN